MDFIIKPYEGVEVPGKGVISFGMTSDEVRRFFDEDPWTNWPEEDEEIYRFDQYERYGVSFTFDPQGTLYRIVGTKRAQIFLDNTCLKGMLFSDLFQFLKDKGHEPSVVKNEGCKSGSLGLVIYSEGPLNSIQKRPPQGIILYRQGRKELCR